MLRRVLGLHTEGVGCASPGRGPRESTRCTQQTPCQPHWKRPRTESREQERTHVRPSEELTPSRAPTASGAFAPDKELPATSSALPVFTPPHQGLGCAAALGRDHFPTITTHAASKRSLAQMGDKKKGAKKL